MEEKLDKIIELLEKAQKTITEQEELIDLLQQERKLKQPIIQYMPNWQCLNPNLHFHGSQPCYNNPCIWC